MLRVLAELLRFETKDPGLSDVSLTAVDLSRDLSVARVYFSLLDPNGDPAAVYEGLEKASGFLRGKLGRSLRLPKAGQAVIAEPADPPTPRRALAVLLERLA